MAKTGERNDPFPAFRFKVSIDGMAGGFSECSGLAMETETFEYAEGGVNDFVHKLPTRSKQGNLTLKRGVVDAALWNWYFESAPGKMAKLKGGSIMQLDERGKVVQTWRFQRAWPRKVQGPAWNAAQSSVSVETLEICHHGLTVS